MIEQRTRPDFAQTIRWLVDEVYLEARVICLVMDNLNTHTAASLYEAFPPEEAQRASIGGPLHAQAWQLARVLAEMESSNFERGCLSKRVKSLDHL